MRQAYRILAMLIAVGVVVQAAAIAFALFDIQHRADDGHVYAKATTNGGVAVHAVLGDFVIPIIAVLLLVVSFLAGIPDGVKWAAITFGVLVLQIVLAVAGHGVPWIGVLHGINAFALAAVASIAMRKARLAETPAVPATT